MARILLIDDEPMIRTVVRQLFEPRGHEVLLAEDGARGIAMAQRQHPDVIILDLMMPIMDGYRVMEILGQQQRTARIPVIVLTALPFEEVHERCVDAGARTVLVKPFDADQLNEALSDGLERGPQPADIFGKDRSDAAGASPP